MPEHLTTTKLTPTALRLARLVAAATGEKQYALILRLLLAEARRLGLGDVRSVTENDSERAHTRAAMAEDD